MFNLNSNSINFIKKFFSHLFFVYFIILNSQKLITKELKFIFKNNEDNLERMQKIFHLIPKQFQLKAFKIAGSQNCQKVFKFLLSESNRFCVHGNYPDLLKESFSKWKSLDLVQQLVDFCVRHEKMRLYEIFHSSVRMGSTEVIQYLLEEWKFDMNIPTYNYNGESSFFQSSLFATLPIFKFLVEQGGGDLNHANPNEETVLWIVSSFGKLEIVRYLIENFQQHGKIDINKQNKNGESILWIACFRKHFDVVRCLVDAGANLNLASAFGESPLQIACFGASIEIVRYLIEKGAFVDTNDIDTVEYLKENLLLEKKV